MNTFATLLFVAALVVILLCAAGLVMAVWDAWVMRRANSISEAFGVGVDGDREEME